jgi:uncharacterized protein
MHYLAIGLLVGLTMGLTGAGGALISIPLFMGLANVTLKEATVLSLIAVVTGTGLNMFAQTKKADKQITIIFFIAGSVINYASLPLKKILPEAAIAALLLLIGLYSLISIWNNKMLSQEKRCEEKRFGVMIAIGGLIGFVTALTGLGGGVLLIPLLMRFFALSYPDALPTSLMTIFLISLLSLVLQRDAFNSVISFHEVAYILGGSIGSLSILKFMTRKIAAGKLDLLRKFVFTGITIYSIIAVMIKSLV